MTRNEALRKVRSCLRLAASSNPNEAATALRHARALMAQHGLSESDAIASQYREATSTTRCRGAMLPRSLTGLMNLIADGFRCKPLVETRRRADTTGGRTVVIFLGSSDDAQIAAYAFDVMRRQLDSDRAKHTARIRKRSAKTERGEIFALGWVAAVAALFPPAEQSDEQAIALDNAFNTRFPDMLRADARQLASLDKGRPHDYLSGMVAGRSARFSAGIPGSGAKALGHHTGPHPSET